MGGIQNARWPANEVARAIAEAAAGFPLLGKIEAPALLELVRLELGHPEILDGFRPYGGRLARAIPPGVILHVVSGNTPHAALQSLIRGLLLQSRNRVKIPSAGLPEVAEFRARLPGALAELVEISDSLPEEWLRGADAVVVFGDDETISRLRAKVPAGIPFQAHGRRVSFGIVFEDRDGASAAAAARDVSLYDQQGCLSPHAIYVDESGAMPARSYAARLAVEMEAFNQRTPRRRLSIGESAAIANLRASYAFRSANDVRTQIWTSADSTDWTVIFEEEAWFATSPLNRVVFVKPLPADLAGVLAPVRPWLGAIGIWPAAVEHAARVAELGASRICALGEMQFPPLTWHAEGIGNLSSLIRWVDFEPGPH